MHTNLHESDTIKSHAFVCVRVYSWILLSVLSVANLAHAELITVDPAGEIKTISAGIAAARPGDTVRIRSGVYREAVVVSVSGTKENRITIEPLDESAGPVVIDARGEWAGLVSNNAWFITLRKVTIRNAVNPPQNEQAALRVGTHWIVEDVTVEGCHGQGIGIVGDNATLIRCVSQDNGQMGWGGFRIKNAVIRDCISRRNNRGMADPVWRRHPEAFKIHDLWYFNPAWESGGGKWMECDNVRIENMQASENGGPGIWLDYANTNMEVIGCRVWDNRGVRQGWEGAGIAIEINPGPVLVEGNIVHGNTGGGIAIWETKKLTVRNNRLDGNGIELRDMKSRGTYHIEDLVITGNFLRNCGLVGAMGDWEPAKIKDRNITIDRNTWDPGSVKPLMRWGKYVYPTLADAQKGLGIEASGTMGAVELFPATRPTPPQTHADENR